MSGDSVEERIVMVFLRDTHRDLATGYKTRAEWVAGEFHALPWTRSGEFGCDSVRGPMLYGSGEYAAGASRFVIERIVTWDSGETVYSETDA